ncbi:helix-turn-helix domain-containing protein [uncultured Desulfovibrio sp.]|uniref:helix-turn-helix domain-containing protein n=1 Tax=uncultured Desulfovibrio sp. TaxID=167968 RepID=UPI00261B2281|nr:helix-turn-helix domain-containing protein [uncultured Desulfovibrio sp.]
MPNANENIASHPPLTTAQAAEFLQLHPISLARMRQYGRGPAYVKRGGLVYYLLSDIVAWLEEGRVQPGKKQAQAGKTERRGRPRKVTPVAPVEDADAPASAGAAL